MQLGQCSVTRNNFTHHCPPVGYCRNLVQKKDFSLFNYIKEKYLLTTSLLQYAFLSKMTSHISGLNKTATVLELKGRRHTGRPQMDVLKETEMAGVAVED